ncbi:hypothetical protein QJQ45_026544 [Haematococcus lacustris]|nr:hypothetical protein QJQ45_026544 [Haematococcus lacustris]
MVVSNSHGTTTLRGHNKGLSDEHKNSEQHAPSTLPGQSALGPGQAGELDAEGDGAPGAGQKALQAERPDLLDLLRTHLLPVLVACLEPLTVQELAWATGCEADIGKTNLVHAPALRIQLDSQRCDQFLTPRVVAALQARTCKLALTLEQQRAQSSRQYIRLLTEVLKKLASCAAVETCKLGTSKAPSSGPLKRLGCTPDLAQHFMDSFPGLTSLSLHNCAISCSGLAALLSHPQLSLQLQQLDLSSTTITQAEQLEPGAATLDNLFHASRLKQLSLSTNMAEGEKNPLLPNLQPLSEHLTQLCIKQRVGVLYHLTGLDEFTAALQPLAQLRVLTILCLNCLEGLPRLLQALPQLHTLQLPDAIVRSQEQLDALQLHDAIVSGEEQLDALLAATQLTSIKLSSLEGLMSSCADEPCSWQRLELTGCMDCATAAYLPLHSLTQPLVLGALHMRNVNDLDLMAAAVHNLTQACKVPVRMKVLRLDMLALPAQQHDQVQQLVAELEALKHCSWDLVLVEDMNVEVANVATLAPLCLGCNHLKFLFGSVAPSLEYWRQLVQLMPTVTDVVFEYVEGSTSSAMCQQTVPAMSQRDSNNHVAVDGSASRADGYSPTGEAPPPASRLLDLPPALLDDIACRVMQLGARSLLPLTCHAFSQAHLLHVPALRIQLCRPRCDQLLTPRIIAALRARRSKLALTFEPQTQTQIEALVYVLAHLGSCVAVDAIKLYCRTSLFSPWPLDCTPELAQRLVDSFPSLTALSLHGHSVTSSGLASILSYPPLALQLQQLDLTRTAIQQPQQPGPGLVTLDDIFLGARLNQLTLYSFNVDDYGGEEEVLFPSLQPLAQHLTYLSLFDATFSSHTLCFQPVSSQRLLHLRELCVYSSGVLEGLPELLQALPQLHTLQLPGATVQDQHLDTLLAATQITSVQFGIVHGLDASRADAPCSWQQLQVVRSMDCISAACLPLHSLIQPMNVKRLCIGVDDISGTDIATAVHSLTQACQVPVTVGVLSVNVDVRSEGDREVGILLDDPVLVQQQRSHLWHWVAQLHALQHRGKDSLHPFTLYAPAAAAAGTQQHSHPRAAAAWAWGMVEVSYLFAASAADVTALAPLCQACTRLKFRSGSIQATLEFWQQLVQLMPAVQQVTFWSVAGAATEAMCESLRLMAGQPWARWLDIKVSGAGRPLPACCLDMNKVFSNP